MLKKLLQNVIVVFLFLVLPGCAAVKQSPREKINSLGLADISDGLPREGMWRQNIEVADMDGDGFLDIIAPPPRKAQGGKNIPHIFLRDPKAGTWREDAITFPPLNDYNYGGIAVGDINRDGYPDIVLAVHGGRIIALENNKSSSFVESPFPLKDHFQARTVSASDVNGDGWTDIIALSEAAFAGSSQKPKGVIVAFNKDGLHWDVKTLGGSSGLFGDSLSIGDINGDGNKDIIIAPLVARETKVPCIWFGDGKGAFKAYEGDLISGDVIVSAVDVGDLDGDGNDEVVLKGSAFGVSANAFLSGYKWMGAGFTDISKGLEGIVNPIAFSLSDTDRDGKKKLIVLVNDGIRIYKYTDTGWIERGYYELPSAETIGAYAITTGRNKDGSLLVVYNLGEEGQALHLGIRAFLLK